MMYPFASHVIFDLDGLLLDTEILYTEAYAEFLSKYGHAYSFELKLRCMGRRQIDSCQLIIDEFKLPLSASDVQDELLLIYERLFPFAELMPGAEKLVKHFHKHGIPMGICTGSSKQDFALKTKNYTNLLKLFEFVCCSSTDPEVKLGKPSPDCFLISAKRFSSPPKESKNILVFEDAINGVDAAIAAGMQVVMVPDVRVDPILCQKATLVLRSLNNFEPQLFGLPAF